MAKEAKIGRLHSRPNAQKNLGSNTTGLRQTGLETERDGYLYVPESFNPRRRTALIVSLHGAGGEAIQGIEPLRDLADHTGTILLAPQSQGRSWDLIGGGYGPDVFLIDEALSDVFALYPIDPKHVAIAGFSDGASYALSLGLTNADLFSHIIAFSPGFASPLQMSGSPKIFVSHGVRDSVLPIDTSARTVVPRLKNMGFEVTYKEFDGGHTIPKEIGRAAFNWFLGPQAIVNTADADVPSHEAGIEAT